MIPNELLTELSNWRGAESIILQYEVGMRQLSLVLRRPEMDRQFLMSITGCQEIHGPLRWENACLSVVTVSGSSSEKSHTYLLDPDAGFILRCGHLTAAITQANDPDHGPQRFLGQVPWSG